MSKRSLSQADLVDMHYDVEQGSDDWFALKIGVPSASNFFDVMAGNAADGSKTRMKYMRLLGGEQITGIPMETFTSKAMERGKEMEAEICSKYSFEWAVDVRHVGFIKRTIYDPILGDLVIGCSPDGLIDDDGGLEIKTLQPDLLMALIDSGRFPVEHVPQVQGSMWVSGRSWWDLVIGFRGFRSQRWRIRRDDVYIRMMQDEMRKFDHELRQMISRVRVKGGMA